MVTTISLLAALILDRLLGEFRRWHPLVGFGQMAIWLEARLYGHPRHQWLQRISGTLAWLILVGVPSLALLWAMDFTVRPSAREPGEWLLGIVVLYFCLGGRSLEEHARAVSRPLAVNELATARRQLSKIVSRDTMHLESAEVAAAGVESVLENGCDGVLASLFWFTVVGAPGVLLHRLANTLDAMWGYRNDRYRDFGWCAARMDDLLTWIPARLCALCYALSGRLVPALRCWREQAGSYKSPNGGAVMSSGAGALGTLLGGPARYHGVDVSRPPLGDGRPATYADIDSAIGLLRRAVCLWLAGTAILEIVFWAL